MNIQTMLDRLQEDIESIHGFSPRLSVARVPLYEALWRDLLLRIELMGGNIYHLSPDADQSSSMTTVGTPLRDIPSGDHTPAVRKDSGFLDNPAMDGFNSSTLFRFVLDSQAETDDINVIPDLWVPDELQPLVLQFVCTRLPSLLRAIRQVCLLTYKSKSNEITKSMEEAAVSGFLSRNAACHELSKFHYTSKARSGGNSSQVLKLSRLLINMILDPVDWSNIRPSHGPGAVSDAKKGRAKWAQLDGRTTRMCDKYYPLGEFFSPTPDLYDYRQADYVPSVCKLAVVPKDKRGPRIICTQPTGLMWVQQGQRKNLERAIESSPYLRTNRYLRGAGEMRVSIKFDKQEQNGGIALEASSSREYATIDLKDASDLVSWGLVKYLLNKQNLSYVAASRAMYVRVPGEPLVRLHMFAPMGSAMCFPIESLIFWVVAAAATYVQRGVTYEHFGKGRRFLPSWLAANLPEVFVFGDDVICRSEYANAVCETYAELGFKPNFNKTFSKGLYRESCGVDAYRGERLDIVRLQSTSITSMSDVYATVDLANRARGAHMVQLSNYLETQVEAFLGFPLAAGTYPGCLWNRGWPCNSEGAKMALSYNIRRRARIRFNPNLQRFEAMSVIASPRTESAPQDGRCRLFRGLTTGVEEHAVDWLSPDNLRYYLGWVAAF